jgi:hypothetical protein
LRRFARSNGHVQVSWKSSRERFTVHGNVSCERLRPTSRTRSNIAPSVSLLLFRSSHQSSGSDSMGNNIYILLVGLWPFYQYNPNNSRAIQNKLIEDTERPYVDPRYRNRSEIEGGLVSIMEQCWEWDMDKRLSIFEVVRQLHNLRDRVRSIPR